MKAFFLNNCFDDLHNVLDMRLSKCRLSNYYYFLSFLLFCGNIYSVTNEITYVERKADGDKFGNVSKPSENCYKNHHANRNSPYDCICPEQKFTFLYNISKCVTKKIIADIIKAKSDCYGTVIINKEGFSTHGKYMIINLHKASKYTLGEKISKITNGNGGQCIVNQTHYIEDTNGQLIQSGLQNIFTINASTKSITWSKIPANNSLHGRIISLQTKNCKFDIKHEKLRLNPCIVFKAEGRQTFNTPATSSTTTTTKPVATSLHSIDPSPSASTKHSRKVTTTSVGTSVKNTETTATKQPSNRTSTSVPVTSSTISDGHSKPPHNEGQKDEQSTPIGLIVGPVVGLLVTAVVIIIIIFVLRRRTLKSTRNNSKAGNGQNHSDSPVYGRGETINLSNQNKGNELEYDYAVVDGDPRASNGAAQGIYQSLIKDPNRESVYTPLEKNNSSLDQSYGYNQVERPLFKPAHKGPSDPTYSVLQRPCNGSEPGDHIDKNKTQVSKQAPPNNEPVYNILEGPNPEGEDEPEYNVFQAPDEPEYTVLEDPDDNYDYAPVEDNMGHPSSHDNVGYGSTIDIKPKPGINSEPVYEAPEGPLSESTYQALDTNAQDDRLYQPLDRTSRVVPDDQPEYHVLEQSNT